jgi:hypothetical protein
MRLYSPDLTNAEKIIKVFYFHRGNCSYRCVMTRDIVWSGRWIDLTTYLRNLLLPYFALKIEVPGLSSHTTLASHPRRLISSQVCF